MRYFAAFPDVAAGVRAQVMSALGQPNGQADEPWGEDGDFLAGGEVYLALGPHHTDGDFWAPLITAALASGVREVNRSEYLDKRPQGDPAV